MKAVDSAVEEVTSGPMPVGVADAMPLAAASAPTPVQPGELTVTARLQVTYTY